MYSLFEKLTSGYTSVYKCEENSRINIDDLPDDIIEQIFNCLGIKCRKMDNRTMWYPYRQMNLEFHRAICPGNTLSYYPTVARGRLTQLRSEYDLDFQTLSEAFWFDMMTEAFNESQLDRGRVVTAVLRVYGPETSLVIKLPKSGCGYAESTIHDGIWDGTIITGYNSCRSINYFKARNFIKLKSVLFCYWVCALPGAEAYATSNIGKIWIRWLAAGFDMLVIVLDVLSNVMNVLGRLVAIFFAWLLETNEDGTTRLDYVIAFTIAVMLVWFVHKIIQRLCRTTTIIISQNSDDFTNSRIIGEKQDSTGHSFVLLHNNKKYDVKKDYAHGLQPQDEMALPGSDFYPSAPRPVGAILVSNDNITFQVIGCFFRYEDCLITAKHVASAITCGTSKIKLSGTVKNRRGHSELNDSVAINVETSFFDEDENLARDYTVDLFVKRLTPREWAKLALHKCGVRTKSQYDLCVSLVGFQNGIMVTSNGKTLTGSGGRVLHYNASTLKGFSGTAVWSGNTVVGMHYQGDVDRNVAIRREMITPLVTRPVQEGNYPYTTSYSSRISVDTDVKSYGDPFEDYYGKNRFLRADGTVTDEYSDEEMDVYYDLTRRAGKIAFGDHFDYDDEDYVKSRKFKRGYRGDYECALEKKGLVELPIDESNSENIVATVPLVDTAGEIISYIELPRGPEVHCAPTGVVQSESLDVINHFLEEIVEEGFDGKAYEIPEITKQAEVTSVCKHFELWCKRCHAPQTPPSESEQARLINIMENRLGLNFMPDPNYDSLEYILDVINTSAIGARKSAGRPYQANGMATIGDVLKNYGPSQFAEIVRKEWYSSFEYKLFLKNEPHKIKKIEAEMLRIITCMPAHKLVKNNCIFRNYLNVTSEAWKENNPMFYGFNPVIPNATEKLKARFEGKILHGADKTNWDFNYFGWMFDLYKQYICRIVRCPESWDEERFEHYKNDVRQAIDEVYKDCVYVTSNGRRFKQVEDGVMKSGWFLTIDANTFAQIAINTLALMRCGFSDDDIVTKFDMAAGGDDTLETFPDGYDTTQYYEEVRKMGIDIQPDKITVGLIGNEYFSAEFQIDRDGLVTFHPKRWTKQISKLKLNRREDLPQAINSLMQLYCWDKPKFRLLEKMYFYVLEKYQLKDVGSRSMIYWRYKNKGLEIPNSL